MKKDFIYEEAQLASYWNMKFKEAMVAKADYTRKWQTYIDAYNGDYFKSEHLPDYKSDLVSNYIFSTVETIRPIMLDNDPKFQAMPRHPDGMEFSHDLQSAFVYEWDRDKMNTKLYRELITTLTIGTSPWYLHWNSEEKNINAIPINPFNLFPDPLATCVEDAEHIIYAKYHNVERLKRSFPSKADLLSGGDVNYSELVFENDKDSNIDNQVLVLEVWTRDYEVIAGEEGGGVKKYPGGRVITLCPELGIVLSDKKNPYRDNKFPFVLMKDYDIAGKFWGEGEVAQLLSPQKYINELNNAVLDNAKATANMPWIIDKNSGIGYGTITNKPGLIIRKNPGTDVRREQPPSMPSYVTNTIMDYKSDIEQISGIFNSLRGQSETGVYTAQGILALQEAGQARIRIKVKLMEEFLGDLATLWYSRMRQFWRDERWIRITKSDGSLDMRELPKDALLHDYDVRIMAGSTMPVNRGAMLDLMIRLAQTQMPDGQTIVDREAVVEYLPVEIKSSILERMGKEKIALQQQVEELGAMLEQTTQEVGQVIGEMGENIEELSERSDSNDEDVFDVIEDITKAIEEINGQILQVKQAHDKLEEEQKAEAERNELKTKSYNEGYSDAEKLYEQSEPENIENNPDMFIDEDIPLESGMLDDETPLDVLDDESMLESLGEDELGELPDELLEGIYNMTDDELRLLLSKNPELTDLLR